MNIYTVCVYMCMFVYLIQSNPLISHSRLTGHGKASQGTGLSLGLTHPLLAALSGHLNPPWHGAVWPRQHYVHIATWHAGDLPIATHTLVLTAGEEGLTVLVDRTVQNTHITFVS